MNRKLNSKQAVSIVTDCIEVANYYSLVIKCFFHLKCLSVETYHLIYFNLSEKKILQKN